MADNRNGVRDIPEPDFEINEEAAERTAKKDKQAQATEEYPPLGDFVEVIGVRFRKAGKIYFFDPAGMRLKSGEKIIVETSRGVEIGWVETPNQVISSKLITPPLKKMLRAATDEDLEQERLNRQKEQESFDIALEKIKKHNLDMKLVDVEFTFDLSKIIFYFTSDGRVDFRELVKELAYVFRTRIELRQVGVRDEAKLLNGIGVCGRSLCCATFLDEFQPVSIKMAKDQNLSLNPTKISGICGRLMCCLKYEESTYEHLNKNLPETGSFVTTPEGGGEVLSVSVLRQLVKVAVRKKPSDAPTVFTFPVSEVNASKEPEKFKEYREKKAQEREADEQSDQSPAIPAAWASNLQSGERQAPAASEIITPVTEKNHVKHVFSESILSAQALYHIKPEVGAAPAMEADSKSSRARSKHKPDEKAPKAIEKRELTHKPYYMKPLTSETLGSKTIVKKQTHQKDNFKKNAIPAEKPQETLKPVKKTPALAPKIENRKKSQIPAPKVEVPKEISVPDVKPKKRQWRFRPNKGNKKTSKDE